MKRYKILLPILAFTLLLVSCEKSSNEAEPETTTVVWAITEIMARVEIEDDSEIDRELIKQIEIEIMAETEHIGEVLKLSSSTGDFKTGTLVRILKDSSEEIVSDYSFESINSLQYLKIIENGVITNSFSLQNGYLVKDFTEKYSLLNRGITMAVGGAKYTIPK